MKATNLVLMLISGLLMGQTVMASTMVVKPGTSVKPTATPTPHSVMSMGKIDAINLDARKIRVNGVDYSFDAGTTRFINVSGAYLQPEQLKAGDWIHFWIKPATGQHTHTPAIDRVELLVNPEMGKTTP